MFETTINELHRLAIDQVVPGVSYALFDGRNWQSDAFGLGQVVPTKQWLRPGLTYDLASLTKVVVTTPLILQLIEEDQVGLTDAVSDYLPEWTDRRVTIKHLLTHTSGIVGYIPNRNQLDADDLTAALLTQLHVGPNLNRKMVYADVNFIFLGWIIERVLGRSLAQCAQKRIFTPLNMNGATFDPRPTNCVPTTVTTNGVLRGTVNDPKGRVLTPHCGSAGLFATLPDLIKFVDEALHPTGALLNPGTVRDLLKDHTPNGRLGRSFGWRYDFHETFHFLWQTGFTGTAIVLDPIHEHALVLLTNRVHPHAPNERFIGRRNQIINMFLNQY